MSFKKSIVQLVTIFAHPLNLRAEFLFDFGEVAGEIGVG